MNKFLIVLFVFLSGCYATRQNPTSISTNLPTFAPDPTETIKLPTSIFTPTLAPITISATPPVRTPLPTLANQNNFLDFISFTENSICKFPCWAGVVPGKTSWDETLLLLNPMTSIAEFTTHLNWESPSGISNYIVWSFSGDEVVVSGFVDATVSDQSFVKWVNMTIEGSSMPTSNTPSHTLPLPERFNMQSVLREYGSPSSIFIHTFVHDQSGPLLFKVLLVYPEDQFFIEYHRFAKLNGNSVVACEPEYFLEVRVEDSVDKLISGDAIAKTLETRGLDIKNWKPVEQALNISPEKFHETFVALSQGCMSSLKDLWVP